MEEQARELIKEIDQLCIEYYYFKSHGTIERSKKIISIIQDFITIFLNGNIFGIDDVEYENIRNYSLEVLRDINDALENRDEILMIDTLAYGLRSLAEIFIDGECKDGEEYI